MTRPLGTAGGSRASTDLDRIRATQAVRAAWSAHLSITTGPSHLVIVDLDTGPRTRLHDAWHGRTTLLLAAGVPSRVVMEILGGIELVPDRPWPSPTNANAPLRLAAGALCWWARTVSNRRHLLVRLAPRVDTSSLFVVRATVPSLPKGVRAATGSECP
ncbi:bifunctional DNA primase/polymerase [Streptomyces wuyuanensis]|uniref:bifunctional DNA primase/polymerase n=1 Tax=Streptomyces wuyuanensis TaxID=1196353 RepID=UPI0038181331